MKHLTWVGWVVASSCLQNVAHAQTKSATSKSATSSGATSKSATSSGATSKSATSSGAASSAAGTSAAKPQAEKAAAKSAVPGNLFATNDSAIIIVGGKQVKAGAVKRQFTEELARLSGPPTSGTTTPRLIPEKTSAKLGADPMPALGKGVFWQGPATAKLAPPPKVKNTDARANAKSTPKTCKQLPPAIFKIIDVEADTAKARLAPEGGYLIDGNCLGDKAGTVEINGPFGAGGKLSVVPVSWLNEFVYFQMPQLRGVLDGMASVVLVLPDGRRVQSPPIKFVATRRSVAVPAKAFSQGTTFEHTEGTEGTGDGSFFGLQSADAASAGITVPTFTTPLTVSVDPACGIEEITWNARIGSVVHLDGWDGKPANLAKMQLAFFPRCTRTTKDYVFSSTTTQTCGVAIDFQATAVCPVGFEP